MEPETGKEIVGLIKQTPQILTTIYSDIAQPSVKKVGQALETVFEFSTSILLPIKLLNEKFKLNFERNLNNFKKKIEEIPDEKICDVNPQIGTPIIEKLTYTTNEEIADLFTSLLSKASNIDTVNQAHPSFIQLIERLSVDEARIVKYLNGKDFIPSISIKANLKENKGFNFLIRNATLLQFQVNLIFPQNINTYLDNLTCLGILDINHGFHKTDDMIYKPIADKYNVEQLDNQHKSRGIEKVDYDKSYFQITDYGKQFIRAIQK